jgi:O-antigen/teichoic acid export membrane protein
MRKEVWHEMEKQIIKLGLKNTFFVILAQTISFILGVARAIIIPIALGVTNFGYWQVYLLYVSYIGLFSFGFNDGIYLRYGKLNYEELPKRKLRTSIRGFIIFQLVISIFVLLFFLFERDPNKQSALIWVAINIPIAGLTGVLIYILQVTNQMKKYSFFSVFDKVIILIVISIVFILGIDNFLLIIISDTLSKLLVLILLAYSCKDVLFGYGTDIRTSYDEIIENMRVGIKLMLANICGMLVIGLGRFIVERFETVDMYGIYSFAISTTNLVLVFVSAIGLVVYPTLNRLNEEQYPKYISLINEILTFILFGLLLLYFPLRVFINHYMIEYTPIFEYLPIVFAIIFIQAKMQIFVNPYYKLLREEKAMLKANLTGLLMAVLFVVPTYIIFESIPIIALGTFLAMTIRLYLSEVYLKKKLNLNNHINIIFELLGLGIFIIFAYQNNFKVGLLGYSMIYTVFIIVKVKLLIKYFEIFKSIRRH